MYIREKLAIISRVLHIKSINQARRQKLSKGIAPDVLPKIGKTGQFVHGQHAANYDSDRLFARYSVRSRNAVTMGLLST